MPIGTLGEHSLHAELKEYLAQPGDVLEKKVDGYFIDIVRGEELIEIQTSNFSGMKRKLRTLLESHRVRVVYPVAARRWLLKLAKDGESLIERRKSPYRGTVYTVFDELVSIPKLMAHPDFTLDVLLVHEEEVRCNDGEGSWRRRGWSIIDHRLLEVADHHRFETPADLLTLLPDIEEPFTNRELAHAIEERHRTAGKMTYCLRKMGLIEVVGKRGNAYLHRVIA